MVEMVELATPERTQGARASEDARDADETSLILVLAFVPMGPRGFNRFPACDLAILNERQIAESLIEAFSPCLIALYNGISTAFCAMSRSFCCRNSSSLFRTSCTLGRSAGTSGFSM
jgi:hypothetical protein